MLRPGAETGQTLLQGETGASGPPDDEAGPGASAPPLESEVLA